MGMFDKMETEDQIIKTELFLRKIMFDNIEKEIEIKPFNALDDGSKGYILDTIKASMGIEDITEHFIIILWDKLCGNIRSFYKKVEEDTSRIYNTGEGEKRSSAWVGFMNDTTNKSILHVLLVSGMLKKKDVNIFKNIPENRREEWYDFINKVYKYLI